MDNILKKLTLLRTTLIAWAVENIQSLQAHL